MNTKRSIRIAYCFPVLRAENSTEASFLQQKLITDGLKDQGHRLTYVAQAEDLSEVICTQDISRHERAARTWTISTWFVLARKVTWRIQQLFHIPYLNVFSNLCFYDACLQILPGHDVVHERNGLYRMGVAMACRRLHLPYVFFFDADDILEHDLFGRPLNGILRWRAKQALRYNLDTAARVICVSESAKNHLIGTWSVPPEKIAVLPNAVDVNIFRPHPEEREGIRKKFNIGSNPLILFVGSFFPYQDLKVLLNAFTEVLKVYPDARLLLVGQGEQYQQTIEAANALGISKSVHFTGFLPHSEIPSILAAADIAVAPYFKVDNKLFLGSSMKLFEYMASGIATIASDIGQISEVINVGVNGLLVPPEDINALASALRSLLDHPQKCIQLGEQARKDVVEKFSWDQYIAQLERIYRDAIFQKL